MDKRGRDVKGMAFGKLAVYCSVSLVLRIRYPFFLGSFRSCVYAVSRPKATSNTFHHTMPPSHCTIALKYDPGVGMARQGSHENDLHVLSYAGSS